MLSHLHTQFENCCRKSTGSPVLRSGEDGHCCASKESKRLFQRRIARSVSLRLSHSSRTFVLFALMVFGFATAAVNAQLIDAFDGGSARFRLWKDDAQAGLVHPSKSEAGIETFDISCRTGSYIYLEYPIEPCAIIHELTASIRVRSAASGMKVGFRVVFPHALHPATHAPLAELVLGTPTEGAGRWSTSSLTDVVRLVEERQRFLRTRYGPDVDLREPYVDAVLLSVYSLPGTTRILLDDLNVDGMIAPTLVYSADRETNAAIRGVAPMNEQLRLLQSQIPRWVQHRGESLAYLKSLGFNGVVSVGEDSSRLAQQAAETAMQVIIPPPPLTPTESVSDQYRFVSAWLLGLGLNESHLESTRQQVAQLARFPQSLNRPLIGEAMEMYGSYSRLSDWLAVPTPLPTAVRSSQEASRIIQSDLRPMAGRTTPLTSIATHMSRDWVAQRQATSQMLGHEPWLLPDYDRLQARLQLIRGIMQGSRGWIFQTPLQPLDSGEDTSNAIARGFASINTEIDLLSPWIQAGESSWKSLPVDSPEHRAAIIETPSSQLVLIVAAGPWDQVCSTAPARERLQFTLPISGQPRQVYRITHGQLERCRTQSTPGGMNVVIERPGLVEQIVSVIDGRPVTYLREALNRLNPELVEARIDIATQVLQIAQMTLVAQQAPPTSLAWEQVRSGQSLQRAALNFLARSDLPRALEAADRATLEGQAIVRTAWESALSQFPTMQSSPLLASPLSLPLHWELDRILAGRTWQKLNIPGVPFASLDSWTQSGWLVDHRIENIVESSVQVTPQVGPDGLPTLLLTAMPRDSQPIPTGYAGASMRVTSPTISVPQGALVHIEGLVQVSSLKEESQSGLLVCDNFAGESLGQLISSFDPDSATWRRFSLFRTATRTEGLHIFFETRGQVQAAISDLKVEMIMPTTNRSIPVSRIDGQPSDENR